MIAWTPRPAPPENFPTDRSFAHEFKNLGEK
jgi:hypothetical protein